MAVYRADLNLLPTYAGVLHNAALPSPEGAKCFRHRFGMYCYNTVTNAGIQDDSGRFSFNYNEFDPDS